MIERIPIRARLSLGHALWMAIIFMGIGFGVYRVVEDNVVQSLDATLASSARNIRDEKIKESRTHRGSRYWDSVFEDFFSRAEGPIKSYAQLIDASGAVQAKTRNFRVRLPVTRLALSRAEQGLETFETFKINRSLILRQVTMPVFSRGRFTGELVQVGSSMAETISTLKSVRRMLTLTLGIGLAMSVVFGYQLTRWSLKPVTRVTNAVATLGVDDKFDKRLKLPPAQDELRELMSTFNEMIQRLEDAFSRLKRFSGDVSHELRTPIAVLKGEAELALRRVRSPEEYQQTLRTILSEADGMSAVVEDLLLLARAQGKSIELQYERVEVDRFLSDLIKSIKPKFDQKGVFLKFENTGEEFIEMSPGYIGIVMKNLLLNACKHSAKDSSVILKVSSTYNETRFDVIDEGEGIPKESLPYIFDSFYRADTVRNRGSGGVGIGLSLARALVVLHGGRLTVESEIGQGSKFRATLPHQKIQLPKTLGKKNSLVELINVENGSSRDSQV